MSGPCDLSTVALTVEARSLSEMIIPPIQQTLLFDSSIDDLLLDCTSIILSLSDTESL